MMPKGRNTGGRKALYRHAQLHNGLLKTHFHGREYVQNNHSTLKIHKEGQQETRGNKYMVMSPKDPE
jgi:hypothetical protein